MRILHILDHSIPLQSGYSFRTRAILTQQRALGLETAHVTSSKHYGAKADEEDVDGFHFYRTFPSSGLLNKWPVVDQWAVVLELERRLKQVIEKEQPDILHAHSPCLNGLAALRVGRQLKIPVVYELRASWEDAAVDHGTTTEGSLRYRLSRALETYVLKRADAITTICEGLRDDILVRGISSDDVTVIPNAVDVERFKVGGQADPALLMSLGLENKKILGFIGSFYAYEGLLLLLEALPAMLVSRSDIRVLLVGGGPQEKQLKEQAERLGIADAVIFTGRVPHDQVHAYYDLVDIFVYPRLSMRLTEIVTPLKPLEAMAQKHIVVASDVGGHRELIQDGKNGMLFKANDKDALARVVLETLENTELTENLREAGRRFVETQRNWKVSVSRYLPVYERLSQAPPIRP